MRGASRTALRRRNRLGGDRMYRLGMNGARIPVLRGSRATLEHGHSHCYGQQCQDGAEEADSSAVHVLDASPPAAEPN